MKLATLLAGVAAATLVAGAASAQDIHKGQATGPISGITVNLTGNTPNVPYPGTFFGNILAGIQNAAIDTSNAAGAANAANANNGNSLVSSWHAIGNAVNNNGSASGTDGATFTLTGNVTQDCAYYSGDNNTETLNFGQLGIYASDDTGPAAAFTMVAPAVVSIDTNLAGCNTANRVTIAKNNVNGMVNSTGTGYDSTVFQANLPYQVTASYTAPNGTSAAELGASQTLIVSTGELSDFDTHGAWKSAMSLDVLVPTPAKALLAGDYSGSFTVTISAGI